MDPIVQFKEMQRAQWANFHALEHITATSAPSLIKFAGVTERSTVADVGCGTGVVALTAARLGAKVTGVDLTPELIERAKENAALMQVEATWHVGDVEQLPLPDASFDFVLSQFGHMFAPRPGVAIAEMLRVLKPGGTIAFTTWPPELLVGQSFSLMGKHSPPPLPGVSPPVQWGDPNIVRERLGDKVTNLMFTRDTMWFPTLSPQHFQQFMENSFAPAKKMFSGLDASDPAKANALRREVAQLGASYFDAGRIRQDYLITRAIKA